MKLLWGRLWLCSHVLASSALVCGGLGQVGAGPGVMAADAGWCQSGEGPEG